MSLVAAAPVGLKPATQRRYDIDVLRVGAVLLLIHFHSACVFMEYPFHIQNPQRSRAATLLVSFLGQWHMPLFMLLAGASTWLALDARSNRAYVSERFRRLFLPAVFGILLVIPPQVYVERISSWSPMRQSPIDFHGSYWAFYPHFFEGVYPQGNFSWHHLWFIVYLFAYSIVMLPAVRWLKSRPGGQRVVRRLGDVFSPSGRIFVLAVPGMVFALVLGPLFPPTHALIDDWYLHAQYLFTFLCGALLAGDDRLVTAMVRNRRAAAALAVVLTVLLFWPGGIVRLNGTAGDVAETVARGLNGACWLILLVGYARAHLNRPLPGLRYAARIAFPFYILHQTVIVILAYYVVRWPASMAAKYALISTAALLITLGLCELVRRTAVTRFIFGMPKAKSRGL